MPLLGTRPARGLVTAKGHAASLKETAPSERRAPGNSPPRRASAPVPGCGRAGLPRRPATPFPVATTARDGDAQGRSPSAPSGAQAAPRARLPLVSALTQLPSRPSYRTAERWKGRWRRRQFWAGRSSRVASVDTREAAAIAHAGVGAGRETRARAARLYGWRVSGPASRRHPLVPVP